MRHFRKKLFITLITLAGILSVVLVAIWAPWFQPSAPVIELSPDIQNAEVRVAPDQSRWLEGSYLEKRGGVLVCQLAGSPEWRGAAMARLMGDEIQQAERWFLAVAHPGLPGYILKTWPARYYPWYYGQMVPSLPTNLRQELIGLAAAKGAGLTGFYLNLASQTTPIAHGQGWAFGTCSPGGAPLLAQQLECGPAARHLDSLKLVTLVKPEKGWAYLSAGYPGLIGVVAGLNDVGLGVVVIPGPGAERNLRGLPSSLLARQVLNQACTLAEAVAMLKAGKVFAPATFLVASAAEHRVLAVEKNLTQTQVREAAKGYLTALPFFQSPGLAQEAVSVAAREQGPAGRRVLRLRELLEQAGPVHVEQAVGILRDDQGAYRRPLGHGHPAALHRFQTSQAVVLDLARKTLWVSVAPSPLAEFAAFRLDRFPRAATHPLPADARWPMEKVIQYHRYREGLREAEHTLLLRRNQECLAKVQELSLWNPRDYRPYLIAGQALLGLQHWDEAYYNLTEAQNRHPAYPHERARIHSQLKRLKRRLR